MSEPRSDYEPPRIYVEVPLTEDIELLMCPDCGALVGSTDKHEAWHGSTDV